MIGSSHARREERTTASDSLHTFFPRVPIRAIALTIVLAGGMHGCSRAKTIDQRDIQRQLGGRDAACSRPPLEIFLQADRILNRNSSGQSMPVEVRILLLKSRGRFDHLDFEEVWQAPADALGEDLVSSASVTVFPNRLKIYPMKSAPFVSHIALVALFRRPQQRSWQYVVDIRKENERCSDNDALHTLVHARLSDNTVSAPDPGAVDPRQTP